MIFIYLRDGRRLDVPEAVSVIHRSQVVFLDKEGEIVRQLPTDDILAYGHALYAEDGMPLPPEEPAGVTDKPFRPLSEGESLITPCRRHRRSVKRAPQPTSEQSEHKSA
mgnify:CR=1 FL=1